MNISERLSFLIKDRKKTPWGKSLGFTSPSITAMFSGHTPGPEFLNAIRRAENVNLNWLLSGEGQPYIVNHFHSAQALKETVQDMLEDEKWNVHVCDLSESSVLVLSQPGQYDFKGKWIDYQMIEVMVGPGSNELADLLRQWPDRNQILVPDSALEEISLLLVDGATGTYELLQMENALLKQCHPAKDSELQFFPNKLTNQPIELSLMRAVVTLIEDCAKDLGETLTSEQKSRVITAVYRQADRLSLSPDDLTPDSIRTAIDVIRD